jgi:hypothetical protein
LREDGKKKKRDVVYNSGGFLLCVYPAPSQRTISNTSNATLTPSMHLVVTSCLVEDVKSPLVS